MKTAAAAILLLCVARAVPAATLERLSLADMTQRSTAIVHVKAGSSTTTLIGSMIYTQTSFQVLESWKGQAGAQVLVSEPGGAAGSYQQTFAGVPQFNPGDELVLFLWTGRSGRTQVIGLSQGVFQVVQTANGPQVVRRSTGEPLLTSSGRSVADQEVQMPLSKLVLIIQANLAKGQQQ